MKILTNAPHRYVKDKPIMDYNKPIVHLRAVGSPIVVGRHVFVQTVDHPSKHVTNWPKGDGWVMTSPVVKILEDYSFETENTIYKPDIVNFIF